MNWDATAIMSLIGLLLNSIVIPALTWVIKKHKQYQNDIQLEKKGTQALLRNELLHLGQQYIAQNHVSYVDKQNYENMYNAYHNLGSNGAMTEIYKQVMALPCKD
jgi:hypothetical protein